MNISAFKSRSKNDQFVTKEFIGAGSFGEVEKCEQKQTNKIVAVKTIQVSKLYIDRIQEEATTMIKANSDYVLELYDHFYDDNLSSYVIVTPYCKMGGFDKIMKMKKEWELDELLLFFYEIAKGLFDLAKGQIYHLDLKPENILLRAPGQYILCDLGCARKLQNQLNASRSFNVLKISCNGKGGGTTEYASPDLVINAEMTPFSDIWSLGVILYRIIFQRHPLYRISSNDLTKNMCEFFEGNYKISYPESNIKYKPIIEIIKRMLVCSKDKEKRITWGEILEKIYQILKLPLEQANYIITNFDTLLNYTDKTCILISAFLYYLEQLEEQIKQIPFDFRSIVKDCCIFLLTITKEIVMHTKEVPYEERQFYLFDTTKKYITKKQKVLAQNLETQTQLLVQKHKVAIEYGSLLICRERLVGNMGRFYKLLKRASKPTNISRQIELKKLLSIVDFIGYRNQFKYENRNELFTFVKDLINS